jgi:hypothetical protein
VILFTKFNDTVSLGFFLEESRSILWRGTYAATKKVRRSRLARARYFIDLPPDISLSLTQLLKLTGALIVTIPQDVVKAINAFDRLNIPYFRTR